MAEQHGVNLTLLLQRHLCGDWGVVSKDDRDENDYSVSRHLRILSAYPIETDKPSKGYGDNTLWIITEADRSATTILLPDEY